jgi:protein YibB
MNNDISIVTFFFDMGRGDWTPNKGFPHYLHRTVDTYFERFSYMAQLNNEMIIYTHPNFVDRVADLRKGKEHITTIIPFDYLSQFHGEKKKIFDIQRSTEFQKKINPSQQINPEYWNSNYVHLMYMKSFFVKYALEDNLITNDYVAQIDFGYCRTQDKIPPSKKWSYNFGEDKFQLFGYRPYPEGQPIEQVIFNNMVYILGAKQVGHKNLWPEVNRLIVKSMNELQAKNLIDDDQTLWLMSMLKKPEMFNLNIIPDHQLGHDSFVLFNNYNDTVK